MVIVNDKRNMIIFSDALTGINVHQNEPNVMCSFKAVGSKDKVLGKYSDKVDVKRLFSQLQKPLKTMKQSFICRTTQTRK